MPRTKRPVKTRAVAPSADVTPTAIVPRRNGRLPRPSANHYKRHASVWDGDDAEPLEPHTTGDGGRRYESRMEPGGSSSPQLRMKQQLPLYSAVSSRHKRKSPDGVATSNLVCSARVGSNEELFPLILGLHVPTGSIVADVTHGTGIFWKHVPKAKYKLRATDIKTGVDCRKLPYENASIDCVVLDPPYMEGLYRRAKGHLAGAGTYAAFRTTYSNGERTSDGPKYHDAVLDLYFKAGLEAYRVLKQYGVMIVKCQDEVSANTQRLTHVEIINEYATLGFFAKDLFVLVRANKPAVSRMKRQEHARKNHSYFLVFVKTNGANPRGKGLRNGAARRLEGHTGRAERTP